jgi:hypothetical protein
MGMRAFKAINRVRLQQWGARKCRVKRLLWKRAEMQGLSDDVLLYLWTFVEAAIAAPALLEAGDGDYLYGDLMRLVDRCGGCAVVRRPRKLLP